jgi:hypothetical protein
MRSRATFTSEQPPPWKTWLLQEYARYWYGLGVVFVLVFGFAEFARLGAPLGALQSLGLLLFGIVVIAVAFAGYVVLWRRESEAARWIFRGISRLRPAHADSLTSRFPATTDREGEAEVPDGRG